MIGKRVYGDAVAHSIGLSSVPALTTKSLRQSQIAINRLSIGSDQLGMTPRIPPEDTFILAMYLSEVPHHELWSRGKLLISQGYVRNAIRIVNLKDEFSANIMCPHETLVFHIPRAALNECAEDAGGPAIDHLACEPGILDPVVEMLGRALLPAFYRPQEASALFLDHMALALCAHLVHNYGQRKLWRPSVRGGLTPRQARRATDFMAAHFAEDFSLADVARECGLSRGYFTKAFRTTAGVTPHQWRQQFRIEKAKAMLSETSCPIAEIAIVCGFADQSHLTRIFSRLLGQSPANWRKNHRDWPQETPGTRGHI